MNRWLKGLVLLLQIGGGVCGFFLIGRSLLAGDVTRAAMIIHAAFMIIFAFGILAGVALMRKPKLGLILSVIYQGIQIPIIILPAAAFTMFSGASFNVYWHEAGWGTNLLFGGKYYFYINSGEPWCAGVNVLALILFVLLIRETWMGPRSPEASETKLPEISVGPFYRTS